MSELETLLYDERDSVAWVTLNRPDVHNAFNRKMTEELRDLWKGLRYNEDVRCIVLTGAGEKAFCVGIDRNEALEGGEPHPQSDSEIGFITPWIYNDSSDLICPKKLGLWKPIVAAVNGMACGGAFYMLGECDIIVAAEHATFFDPHVTYNMAAVYEPIYLLKKMPFHELLRMTLLGNDERMTAERAHQIGFVTEVVAGDKLAESAGWVASSIAAKSPLAIGVSLRAMWAGLELSRDQALSVADVMVRVGDDTQQMMAGQAAFGNAPRPKPRLR